MEGILKRAQELAADLQPWPGYFAAKAYELQAVARFCGIPEGGKVLEVGCGHGFTAVLLSDTASSVVALDLPAANLATHSSGIDAAELLLTRLGKSNVKLVGGTVEAMPFPDKSFDIIFSSYALNYVRKRDKALSEMRRVLDDNGVVITLVPNFMERIFTPIILYEYLVGQVIRRATACAEPKAGRIRTDTGKKSKRALFDKIIVKADGPYRGSVHEMMEHRPSSWKRLFGSNGFKVVNTFSASLLPVGIFDLLGPCSVRMIAKVLFSANQALGSSAVAKRFCYSLGIKAIKDKHS
jgi:ubiquinone/menaquinone biosynthesis C-methylase UbiE